jgi:hypothetical protein
LTKNPKKVGKTATAFWLFQLVEIIFLQYCQSVIYFPGGLSLSCKVFSVLLYVDNLVLRAFLYVYSIAGKLHGSNFLREQSQHMDEILAQGFLSLSHFRFGFGYKTAGWEMGFRPPPPLIRDSP